MVDGVISRLATMLAIFFLGFIILSVYLIVDKVFIDHKTFKVQQPIIPKKEYIIKNNKVDSVYVYHF